MRPKDRTWKKYGKLTAISRDGSDKHGNARWLCLCECVNKKTVTVTDLNKGSVMSCGCLKSEAKKGPRNPMWNGGKTNVAGYVQIKKPDHPRANNQGYVFEHTLVMEKLVDRPLTREEVVHHKNGKRSDNRPENLRLFKNSSEHTKHHHIKRSILGIWAAL